MYNIFSTEFRIPSTTIIVLLLEDTSYTSTGFFSQETKT